MIFIERYPLKRCQGCVKLIASKSIVFYTLMIWVRYQLCMSSNSWTWECAHTKDGADHVPLIFLSSVFGKVCICSNIKLIYLKVCIIIWFVCKDSNGATALNSEPIFI